MRVAVGRLHEERFFHPTRTLDLIGASAESVTQSHKHIVRRYVSFVRDLPDIGPDVIAKLATEKADADERRSGGLFASDDARLFIGFVFVRAR